MKVGSTGTANVTRLGDFGSGGLAVPLARGAYGYAWHDLLVIEEGHVSC